MKPNSSKNRKLIYQYKFLEKILKLPFIPHAPSPDLRHFDDLIIKVERADVYLMYRRGRNSGLEGEGRTRWLAPVDGPHTGQAGKQGQYLLAINGENEIINIITWPESSSHDLIYGWQVLWGTEAGRRIFTNALYDQVKYLAWVSIGTWYKSTKDSGDTPFGDFVERTMNVTIYMEPEQGFQALQEEANVFEHLWLDNNVIIEGMMCDNHDILYISGMLAELANHFQTDVYFNGMREIANSYPEDRIAASGQFGPVKVLVAEMCGQECVQLEDDSSWISFKVASGSARLYTHGMQGRLPQLRKLVRTVIQRWNYSESGRDSFTYNQEVGMGT